MTEIPPKKSHPARRSIKLDDWPAGDRTAWTEALARGDVLDGRGRGASWAAVTRKTNGLHYGRWLGYLAYVGDLEPEAAPADRVTPENVANYVRHLDAIGTVAPRTQVSMLVGLKEVIRAMAPGRDWRWLQDLCNRLNRAAKPSTEKARRIRPTAEIYGTALDGLARLAKGPLDLERCLEYRDHLMLAFLAARPLRTKNFVSLEIDRHLIRFGERWLITIPAAETKTRADIEFWLPADLAGWLNLYLDKVRPRFPDAECTRQLWLHEKGAALPTIFLYRRIVSLTQRLFGQAINPHLLRDCAATTLSFEAPDSPRVAAALLSHRSAATTERHYRQARSLDAGRVLNGILARVKAELEDKK